MNQQEIDEVKQQLRNHLQHLQAKAEQTAYKINLVDILTNTPIGTKYITPSGIENDTQHTREEIETWKTFKPTNNETNNN